MDKENEAYTYVYNVTDADEIVQEVFVKYLNSNQEFQTLDNEKYWIIRVTINTCKSFITSSWKKKVSLSNDSVDLYRVNKKETNNKLLDIVCSLPPKYKEVIALFYFENYDIKDISKILNISLSSTKKRLERARKIIKERNEQNG